MGGMCRIGARQSNAFACSSARYVRIPRAFQQSGPRDIRETMPFLRRRDTRYSGYPAQPSGALPARAGRGFPQDPGRNELRPAQVRPGIRLDESTVIKYLSMAGGDPEQAERLRRFMLASAAYATCIPLVWLASKFNLIAREPAWMLVAMMVVVNFGLYTAFRAGLNRKFTDPNLTWAQVFVGNVVVMYAVYSFDQGRAVVLNLSLVVLTFGVFHFTTREFVKTALQILAGYAAVINLLMYFKPQTVNVYHQRHARPPVRRPGAAGSRQAPGKLRARGRHHRAPRRRRIRAAGRRAGRPGRADRDRAKAARGRVRSPQDRRPGAQRHAEHRDLHLSGRRP